ncbi:Rnf-Nqr domain containing protein [Borrelia sp. P9F1]|uniref:Rnf-Nqr domain containing protein n=1 Tax=Borrelia sp. P9F1 TaxID=3058374 RepID=UPI002647FD9D|nr:Rnf-Nqr domain containing protein [Borrelia sp. P9F1]WKC58144.1 Rnf-Nqr domain containing protein [Borrelia sp. P9F1]
MQKKTFYVTEKYLRTHLMLFPVFAYTKTFLEGTIISVWISLCILLPAIIINQIELRNQILGIYLLIIGIFVSLTYLFMHYTTPKLYSSLKFSIPILIVITVSFHKNEPFKNLKDPLKILQYSKLPIIAFISLSSIISIFREVLNTGNLQFLNTKISMIREINISETPAYSSNVFLVASLVFVLINTLMNIKGKKDD